MTAPLFDRVALMGLGLIGASLALALRRGAMAREIVGYTRREETGEKAASLGLVDSLEYDPARAAEGADIVILCVPVGAMEALCRQMAASLKAGAILTDAGSVKGALVKTLSPLMPEGVDFVPAHPVAGTERSGPEAGFAELFDGRWCILTPTTKSRAASVAKVRALWEGCGAHVALMEAARHDRILALTSHLPHLVAYAMTDMAALMEGAERRDLITYSAGGFRDFTRLASSDPVMWRDIFLANRDESLRILDRFSEHVAQLRGEVAAGDGAALKKRFTRARLVRSGIIAEGQETKQQDFGRRPLKKKP